uniref:AlNc14C289G10203 protein n=1 Tax=Albugo laibachii Nc14 TaxID=890382 RepID=F0WV58_9STRA|nr:AlNc14C289G10203 [Albugo laibachii Nc14]|eukprot:CCA25297.1 AlNc14C289G10203 [Albugo laibachii Nc14]
MQVIRCNVQPADSFFISKVKDAWTKRWDEKKIQLVRDQDWQNKVRNDGSWSGALQNPGKPFFLQLTADLVRDVNAQQTKKTSYTLKKAMVHCGLACVDGAWSVHHLSQELQRIASDHQNHFLVEPIVVSRLLEEQGAYV